MKKEETARFISKGGVFVALAVMFQASPYSGLISLLASVFILLFISLWGLISIRRLNSGLLMRHMENNTRLNLTLITISYGSSVSSLSLTFAFFA